MSKATRISMLCCLFVSLTVFGYAQVGALAAAGAPNPVVTLMVSTLSVGM